MKINRHWAMPNHNTFDIYCIRKLIYKYLKPEHYSIDPFANKSKIAQVTNDLNPDYNTDYRMDAHEFLSMFEDNSVDFVLYDPPYSTRQVSECYKNVGIEVTSEMMQSNWRTKHIDEITRILKPNGIVMCFGWNTNGAGKTRGMEMIEILIVSHGGSHNDTLCTVETKKQTLFDFM